LVSDSWVRCGYLEALGLEPRLSDHLLVHDDVALFVEQALFCGHELCDGFELELVDEVVQSQLEALCVLVEDLRVVVDFLCRGMALRVVGKVRQLGVV
jgi:hypothetical protein